MCVRVTCLCVSDVCLCAALGPRGGVNSSFTATTRVFSIR